MTTQEAYARWWANEGSAMSPLPDEDVEEFSHRITQIAWSNGAHIERQACAKVCEMQENRIFQTHPARVGFDPNSMMARKCAAAIRARNQP
jgi:hypothetical protein